MDLPVRYGNVGDANIDPANTGVGVDVAGKSILPRAPFKQEQEVVAPDLKPLAGFWDTVAATARQGTISQVLQVTDRTGYNTDTSFDKKAAIDQYVKYLGYVPDEDELAFYMEAVSQDDLDDRAARVQKQKEDFAAMADRPITSFATALVTDAPVDILVGAATGGVGVAAAKVAKVGKVGQTVAGMAVAGAYGAAVPLGTEAAGVAPQSTEQVAVNALAYALGGGLDAHTFNKSLVRKPAQGVAKQPEPTIQTVVPSTSTTSDISENVITPKKPLEQKLADVVVPEIKSWQSLWDATAALGTKGKALANLVLANPMDDKSMSAATFSRMSMLDGERRLLPFEKAANELGLYYHGFNPSKRKAATLERQHVFFEFKKWMDNAAKAEREANPEPNLGLALQDQVRDAITEMPPELKIINPEKDVDWFNAPDSGWGASSEVLLHGHDKKSGEVFRLREMNTPEHPADTGTPVGEVKPKRKAEVLTESGKWYTRHEMYELRKELIDEYGSYDKIPPTDKSKITPHKMSDVYFLEWKNLTLGIDKEEPAKLAAFPTGTHGAIEPHPDPRVQKLVEAYTSSGFAETHLRRSKQRGVEGAEATEFSKYYLPVGWEFNKIRAAGIPMNSIADAFGTQLSRLMPNLPSNPKIIRQMGLQFLGILQGGETGDRLLKRSIAQEFDGLSKDNIMRILQDSGFNDVEVAKGIENLFGEAPKNSVGKVTTNLRKRTEFDLDELFEDADGNKFTLRDFTDNNMDALLQKYNLQMSARQGLARVGITSGKQLQDALDDVVTEAIAAGHSVDDARKVADHVRDSVLGRPTGEPVPEMLRSLNTIGSALQLANSAIYNIAETALLMKEHGIIQTVKHFREALKDVGFNHMSIAEATKLKDIVAGRIITEGRMQPLIHQLDDNFAGPMGNIHETVNWAGQSVRFLNASEYLRRMMISLNVGIIEDRLSAAFKGSIKDIEYFKSVGISDEFMNVIRGEHAKHGLDMEKWNSAIADDLSTILGSATDNTVMAIRRGERPMMMDTAVGKVLFPYMSFVFASHNKVLRRTINRDGYAGLALLALYQTPLAVIAAGATNVVAGREWDKDIEVGTMKAMSFIGMFSFPADLITRGNLGGAAPAFAPFNAAANLVRLPMQDDPSMMDVVKNTPFAATAIAARLGAAAFQEDK